MDNKLDFDDSFYEFIENNKLKNIDNLALENHGKTFSFDLNFALTQIKARQKFSNKLPLFTLNKRNLFPTIISGEQSTNEIISQLHSVLVGEPKNILDMTAGLGIDSMTFARSHKNVISLEIDSFKAKILEHNINNQNISNISVLNKDCVDFINNTKEHFDIIFIDPARRDNDNKKVFKLQDSLPNLIELLPELEKKADRIMVKCSPLLDISQTVKDIKSISKIYIVSLKGEVKELLVEIDNKKGEKKPKGDAIIMEAIDLDQNSNLVSKFTYQSDESEALESRILYAEEKDIYENIYLYEPSAAIMKLAPWKIITAKYPGIKKLAPSSHLFIHEEYISDFPGRILKIEKILKKNDRKSINRLPVNIVSRNYPESAEAIRKKYNLKEGDKNFLYATSLREKKILLLAEKI